MRPDPHTPVDTSSGTVLFPTKYMFEQNVYGVASVALPNPSAVSTSNKRIFVIGSQNCLSCSPSGCQATSCDDNDSGQLFTYDPTTYQIKQSSGGCLINFPGSENIFMSDCSSASTYQVRFYWTLGLVFCIIDKSSALCLNSEMAVQPFDLRAQYISRPNKMHGIWTRLCQLRWQLRPAVQSSLKLASRHQYECITVNPTERYWCVLWSWEQSPQSCGLQWCFEPAVCIWCKYTPDQTGGLLSWLSGFRWSIHECRLSAESYVSSKCTHLPCHSLIEFLFISYELCSPRSGFMIQQTVLWKHSPMTLVWQLRAVKSSSNHAMAAHLNNSLFPFNGNRLSRAQAYMILSWQEEWMEITIVWMHQMLQAQIMKACHGQSTCKVCR